MFISWLTVFKSRDILIDRNRFSGKSGRSNKPHYSKKYLISLAMKKKIGTNLGVILKAPNKTCTTSSNMNLIVRESRSKHCMELLVISFSETKRFMSYCRWEKAGWLKWTRFWKLIDLKSKTVELLLMLIKRWNSSKNRKEIISYIWISDRYLLKLLSIN